MSITVYAVVIIIISSTTITIIITIIMVAIFCPFGLFCEMNTSLPSLQKEPNTAPNLFQRGVEYGI